MTNRPERKTIYAELTVVADLAADEDYVFLVAEEANAQIRRALAELARTRTDPTNR